MALRKFLACINVSMCEEEETFRKAMPTHYLFKIQGFSQLSKNSMEKYESNEFEAEGHKWRLLLYPNGNKPENGGHVYISLYLVLVDDTGSSLPASGELNVIFRLFLFDQIRDRYLIRGDTKGRTRRFHEMKKVWGVPQFVSLAKFIDPSNGYLMDDTCMFGAEVFITKPTRNIECLSMATQETIVTHTQRTEKFSTKIHDYLLSEKFKAGNHNWNINIYPKGYGAGENIGMSLYLNLADCKENSVYREREEKVKDSKEKVKKEEVKETFREVVPTHYLFKIQAFSQISKNSIEKYESNEFEAGGHNWRLSLYPNGNKTENGDGHISLYLMLVDTGSSLPASGELNVFFRLFLFDQIRDRYLIRGDTEGRTRRFHEMKKVWGIPRFVSLAKFSDPSNGYLVDDTCMFGAEVFITKPTRNIECLSMAIQATIVTRAWRIEKFSEKKGPCLCVGKFKAGNHNWNVRIYPKGNGVGKNNSMSLFLKLMDLKENPGLKVNVDLKLRLRDQISGKHIEYSAKHWFNASSPSWGWHKFIGLGKMNDKGKGYLVNDTCFLEVEVKVLGVVTKIPRTHTGE